MVIDEWMKAAMADDTVAAELLFQMKHCEDKSQPTTLLLPPPVAVVPSWGAKKRRTSATTASRAAAAAVVSARKKEEEMEEAEDSTRCSPTTPLSWNGGASPSATADGCDESRSPTHNAARSKATATSEYTGNSASTKKCRRKKTFAELQEEESSLLKERTYLTKEIANVNATYKAERARNESLKRMKLDLGSIPSNKPDSTPDELLLTNSDQPKQIVTVVPSVALTCATGDDTHPQAAESKATRTESTKSIFFIPDLNMMPSEDDSYAVGQCGMS